MLNIEIHTIPHSQQQYPTIGDWQIDRENERIIIYVSDMGNWKYEVLVALHELVEVMLCNARGITQQVVEEFDKEFEANRHPNDITSEPGDQKDAPYRDEHKFATILEKMFASELGVEWKDYENNIYTLDDSPTVGP